MTDPDIQRDEVVSPTCKQHKPTCPNLAILAYSLSSKNQLCQVSIITKVHIPLTKAIRWTNAKREVDEEWYYWQTALKLIQAYGR